MAFIAGKGFAILNSKAEQGDAKAKELLAKLDSIDQDEADRLFSEILGKGGGGKGKDKKIKAPGASATDGQGKITEGAGEQPPTGKTTPKDKEEPEVAAPAEPTGEVKPKAGKTPQDKIRRDIKSILPYLRDELDPNIKNLSKTYGVPLEEVQKIYDEEFKPNRKKQSEQQPPTGKVYPGPDETIIDIEPETAATAAPANDTLSKSAEKAISDYSLNYASVKGNKLIIPMGDGDFDFAGYPADDFFTQEEDAETGEFFNVIDLDKFAQSQGIVGESKAPTEQIDQPKGDPLSNDNLKLTFDKYEGNVDAVLDDLRKQQIDIPNSDLQGVVEGFATGYKYDPNEATDKIKQGVGQVIQGKIQSDIEPDFQAIADEFGITQEEVIDVYNNQLEQNDASVEIDTTGANVQPAGAFGDIEPETQQLAGQEQPSGLGASINTVIERTGGNLNSDQAYKLAEDYGISVNEVYDIADEFKAEQANKNQNAPDKDSLIPFSPSEEAKKEIEALDKEIERISNTQYRNPDDAKNFVDDIKNYESDGKPLTESEFNYYASENNLTKDEAEKALQEYGDNIYDKKPYSWENQDAEQPSQTNPESFADITERIETQNILAVNDNSIEGTLPNGSQFYLEDTGTGYRYRIVNGPDGDEEPLEVPYNESNELINFINNDGKAEVARELGSIESATEKINELKKSGNRINNEEAEQVAREFNIPVADVLDIIGDQPTRTVTGQQQVQGQGVQTPEPGEPAKDTEANQYKNWDTSRKKVEKAASELGVSADLLEGLLELLKRVK